MYYLLEKASLVLSDKFPVVRSMLIHQNIVNICSQCIMGMKLTNCVLMCFSAQ